MNSNYKYNNNNIYIFLFFYFQSPPKAIRQSRNSTRNSCQQLPRDWSSNAMVRPTIHSATLSVFRLAEKTAAASESSTYLSEGSAYLSKLFIVNIISSNAMMQLIIHSATLYSASRRKLPGHRRVQHTWVKIQHTRVNCV